MSNRAFLIGSKSPTPAGRTSDGDPNYAYDTDVIAEGGSYQLPVFWLSLFDESHFTVHESDEYSVPTLVCDLKAALALLEQRRVAVLSAFVGCEMHWADWERLVSNAQTPFLKVDATEVWDLEPNSFGPALAAAVRWFTSGAPDDFNQLLGLGGIQYDFQRRRFTVAGREGKGEHLYGYVLRG